MGTTTIGTRRRGRRSQLGGGGIKLLISVIILAIVAQALYVFIPIYVAVYDFTSEVDNQAQFGAPKKDSDIEKLLLDKAMELELPVDKDHIKVNRSKSELKVSAEFMVPVETLLYTYNWEVKTEKAYPLF